MMGSNDGEANEKSVHQVTVSSFRMAKYETTVGEFEKFVEATGYQTDAEKNGWSSCYPNYEKKAGVNWKCDVSGNLQFTPAFFS